MEFILLIVFPRSRGKSRVAGMGGAYHADLCFVRLPPPSRLSGPPFHVEGLSTLLWLKPVNGGGKPTLIFAQRPDFTPIFTTPSPLFKLRLYSAW